MKLGSRVTKWSSCCSTNFLSLHFCANRVHLKLYFLQHFCKRTSLNMFDEVPNIRLCSGWNLMLTQASVGKYSTEYVLLKIFKNSCLAFNFVKKETPTRVFCCKFCKILLWATTCIDNVTWTCWSHSGGTKTELLVL